MATTHPKSAAQAFGQILLAEQPLLKVDLRTLGDAERELVRDARVATTAARKALAVAAGLTSAESRRLTEAARS